jgi:hypothetical protein
MQGEHGQRGDEKSRKPHHRVPLLLYCCGYEDPTMGRIRGPLQINFLKIQDSAWGRNSESIVRQPASTREIAC